MGYRFSLRTVQDLIDLAKTHTREKIDVIFLVDCVERQADDNERFGRRRNAAYYESLVRMILLYKLIFIEEYQEDELDIQHHLYIERAAAMFPTVSFTV